MLSFCGQDRCSIDANGRIKFSPRILNDFIEFGSREVVLHCLPEGAVAVYPEDVYLQMRRAESRPAEKAASSIVFRRSLRRFGAMSKSEKISPQGRVTVPETYRDFADLQPSSEIMVVGSEIGIELWNLKKWAGELENINGHIREKAEREMAADLIE